jgi:uncharacterized protein YerC
MPRVSKSRELKASKKKKYINDYYSAVASLKNKSEVKSFFKDILTKEEELMLAKRFQIGVMYKLGYFWKEICDDVKVIDATVGRVISLVEGGRGWLKKIVLRFIEQEGLKNKKGE